VPLLSDSVLRLNFLRHAFPKITTVMLGVLGLSRLLRPHRASAGVESPRPTFFLRTVARRCDANHTMLVYVATCHLGLSKRRTPAFVVCDPTGARLAYWYFI
jgi:hypothetical protein